jgi:hypothetical protein
MNVMNIRMLLQPRLATVAVALLSASLAAPVFGRSCYEKGDWKYGEFTDVRISAKIADADKGWTVVNREFRAVRDQEKKYSRKADHLVLTTENQRLWESRRLPTSQNVNGKTIFFEMDFKSDDGAGESCTVFFESRTPRGRSKSDEVRYVGMDCSGQRVVSCENDWYGSGRELYHIQLTLE